MAHATRNSDGKFDSYAWPGGYPLYYLDSDSTVLCPDCANKEDYTAPVTFCDINWEDPDMYCEDCGKRIESAYAEE